MAIATITAVELRERLNQGADLVIVDVRTAAELAEGSLPRAINVPLSELARRAYELLPNRQSNTIVYCAQGLRSAQALLVLQQLGYTAVEHLESGFTHWQQLGFPVTGAEAHDRAPGAERYSRQILLTEVGASGQQRLSEARVLLVGIGGLGSPAALYLAAAGVGTLGLVDPDTVAISNLHRQVIYEGSMVGAPKVECARDRVVRANPEVKVECYPERLSSDSAERIFDVGWDVVLDGADNFPTRYLLNETALQRALPLCHGSIDRFEGQVTTFTAPSGPCYRCLFPNPPKPGTFGACAERGVLGVLPGVIGVLQATEALKLILGIGEPLIGRLLTYDALALEFRQIRYARNSNCPSCKPRVERS